MSTIQSIGDPGRAAPGRRRRSIRDVLLAVDGTFDLAAALRTAAAVRAEAMMGARATVDLRRARIEDAALAAFVREVASQPVAMLGLSRHHDRLLRYLEAARSGTADARPRRAPS